MAAKVASLLTEFADPRGHAFIGGVEPYLRQLDRAVDYGEQEPRLHFIRGSVYQSLGEYLDATHLRIADWHCGPMKRRLISSHS